MKVYEFAFKKLDVDHTSIDFTKSIFKNMFDINEKFHEKITFQLIKFNNYLIFNTLFFLNNYLINTIIIQYIC